VGSPASSLVADLDEVDVGALWSPAHNIASRGVSRDALYVFQILKTSVPIWLADMLAVSLSVAVTTLAFLYLNEMPMAISWFNVAGWCFAFSAVCTLPLV
jgi:hypothetical protein